MEQAKSFLTEFKAFALKGNVFDLAIAVVIGAAFSKIVAALVDSVIMPLLGILLGGVNFTTWYVRINDAVITYGAFIQAVVDFTIIAFVIFLAVRFKAQFEEKKEAAPVAGPSEEVLLLREIRDSVKRG
jgi:large conductance mechanosensitive channel